MSKPNLKSSLRPINELKKRLAVKPADIRRTITAILLQMVLAVSCVRHRYDLPPASKTIVYPQVEVEGVRGRVVRSGTEEALPGVIVEVLLPNSGKRVRVATTGANGQFRFALPEGSYVLQFSLLGFDRVRQPVQTNKSRGQQLEVGLPLGT